MDVAWLEWVGCPEDILLLYVEFKTRITIGGRVKIICRDDGEPGTFLFNTLFNIGVCVLRFGSRAFWVGFWLFAGDDMAVDYHLVDHRSWLFYRRRLRVVCKLQHVPVADFCGWLLFPGYGLVRSPMVIYFKIWARTAHGYDERDFLPAYLAEMSFTYAAVRSGLFMSELDEIVLKRLLNIFHARQPVYSSFAFGGLAALARRVFRYRLRPDLVSRAERRFAESLYARYC